MNKIDYYFKNLEQDVAAAYSSANAARLCGLDPETKVSIPLAKNMAERVEGLIGAVTPSILNSGLAARIQDLEQKYGKLDLRVALTISMEVVQGNFCSFKNELEAIETGIRVGIAYLTMGVVSSPLEGFVELKLKKRKDGKDYFCLMYSGPIRSAGGTAGALSVVIADYIRKQLGYETYDATDDEAKRMITELYDYHDRITNLQYKPSEEEIFFLTKHLTVQIDGDPSEKIEVSNYKDLPRIETNRIRSGPCLVIGECVAQKASKVANLLKRAEGFDLSQWTFLDEFVILQKKVKAGDKKTEGKLTPVYTYIQDLVGGRPVLTHPLRPGGFRLRYGRSRVSGYSSTAIHPATMHILNKYIATGTQLKIERPGKATALTVCDYLEGPIVKLNDGSVLRLETEQEAKQVVSQLKEILFLGDILINYGDFFNRAHPLVPPGYCEEWWVLEVKAKLKNKSPEQISTFLDAVGLTNHVLEALYKIPIKTRIDAPTAFAFSRLLDVPLHPRYTYHWKQLSSRAFTNLFRIVTRANIITENDTVEKIIIPFEEKTNKSFDIIGMPHLVTNNEFIVIENDDAYTINELFDLANKRNFSIEQIKETKGGNALELLAILTDIPLRDKSGTFIGARMGRPEKAKIRKLTGGPHTLFPIGEEGGRLRSFQSALDAGKITAEFSKEWIKTTETNYHIQSKELADHGSYARYEFDIRSYFNTIVKDLDIAIYPDLIKGVKGTTNRDHIPEHFAKGILRAKHDIWVNKDGTTRYDMTQLPMTHFKPMEVQTSVEKLRSLGYEKDIHGNKLENDKQIVELFPQDVILPACSESPELGSDQILLRVAQFMDELLERAYKQKPFYNCTTPHDLVGSLVASIAPHTAAAVVGRIVGFSKTQGFFAHPVFHAAMRRDCDGDEASVILLLDALVNFSKQYLPNTRGATQDAALVLTSKLNPNEVDDMAFDIDVVFSYPLDFYEACLHYKMPAEVQIEQFNNRLGTKWQYSGLGFTHDVSNINSGVRCSAYKTIPSMQEKIKGQMELAEKIRAVDKEDVARLVIEKHLIRDIRGNFRKFSMQQFRCSTCNEKYRRPPLVGKCLKCSGKIIFTISEGSIVKYLEPAISLAEKYNLPAYLKQNLELTKRNVESLFGKDKEKQAGLGQWF